jgi:hypothetical protein
MKAAIRSSGTTTSKPQSGIAERDQAAPPMQNRPNAADQSIIISGPPQNSRESPARRARRRSPIVKLTRASTPRAGPWIGASSLGARPALNATRLASRASSRRVSPCWTIRTASSPPAMSSSISPSSMHTGPSVHCRVPI